MHELASLLAARIGVKPTKLARRIVSVIILAMGIWMLVHPSD